VFKSEHDKVVNKYDNHTTSQKFSPMFTSIAQLRCAASRYYCPVNVCDRIIHSLQDVFFHMYGAVLKPRQSKLLLRLGSFQGADA